MHTVAKDELPSSARASSTSSVRPSKMRAELEHRQLTDFHVGGQKVDGACCSGWCSTLFRSSTSRRERSRSVGTPRPYRPVPARVRSTIHGNNLNTPCTIDGLITGGGVEAVLDGRAGPAKHVPREGRDPLLRRGLRFDAPWIRDLTSAQVKHCPMSPYKE